MERLPRITAVEVIKAIKRAGFFLARQSGSHKIFKNRAGKRVTVPYHSGKDYPSQDSPLYINGCRSFSGKVQRIIKIKTIKTSQSVNWLIVLTCTL